MVKVVVEKQYFTFKGHHKTTKNQNIEIPNKLPEAKFRSETAFYGLKDNNLNIPLL